MDYDKQGIYSINTFVMVGPTEKVYMTRYISYGKYEGYSMSSDDFSMILFFEDDFLYLNWQVFVTEDL